MHKSFLICTSFIFMITLLLTQSCSSSRILTKKKSDFQSKFTNSIDQKFVYLQPGSFMMGNSSGISDERPAHIVYLTHGFYMQTTEVTQGQWQEIMGTKPWSGKKYVQENRDSPAVYVSWYDAKEFIGKLSARDGKIYRLPTEAEWEYAARAGSRSKYSFGDSEYNLGEYAWYDKNAWNIGEKYAHRVGAKKPNQWGLYDMHGNVYEWCEDWYAKNYYSKESMTNPIGPSSTTIRVLRGGSFFYIAGLNQSANRTWYQPGDRSYDEGFRLVCVLGQ